MSVQTPEEGGFPEEPVERRGAMIRRVVEGMWEDEEAAGRPRKEETEPEKTTGYKICDPRREQRPRRTIKGEHCATKHIAAATNNPLIATTTTTLNRRNTTNP